METGELRRIYSGQSFIANIILTFLKNFAREAAYETSCVILTELFWKWNNFVQNKY